MAKDLPNMALNELLEGKGLERCILSCRARRHGLFERLFFVYWCWAMNGQCFFTSFAQSPATVPRVPYDHQARCQSGERNACCVPQFVTETGFSFFVCSQNVTEATTIACV
jgi:hypothetical protein